MRILLNWLASALVIIIAAYLLPGIHVASFVTALVVALVLGILNVFLKPFLILLTLPITLLTFGLFTLVINACLILLAGTLVPGFTVDGFWWALFFSILVSIINIVASKI
ncbi:MAG TPA: phage holin family protein [Methylomirabilota bacterium]|nr:phage holin family protein [Methylomirabilota bacterium]